MVKIQNYPRLANDLLDDGKLQPHTHKLPLNKLKKIISAAIETADTKSKRAILNLADESTEEEIQQLYEKEGKKLFDYFRNYCGDPASTAHKCLHQHCYDVAREQFRNRTLQKELMNSAWRYQYIAKDAASASKRFDNISDLGLKEADFNAVIRYKDLPGKLAIYVSVKNRSSTMGGQDWPKAIAALEKEAVSDKNRTGEYICVFGITIERGNRLIKREKKTGTPHSINTELWLSDFFWPFFSNYSYEEIVKAILEVLISTQKVGDSENIEVPQELLNSFEACCKHFHLLDKKGNFNDAFKLVELFCSSKSGKHTGKAG